jgi:DNA repair photolyase
VAGCRSPGPSIGTATDPDQPAEKKYEITRTIMEELARHRGLEIGVVTKSNLVLRDIDVLRRLSEHNQVFINLTVTTVNTDLARILEPRAPRPDLRLDAVTQLNAVGVKAGVICAPVLPGITDAPKDLESVVRAAKEAGTRYIYANPLFLKPWQSLLLVSPDAVPAATDLRRVPSRRFCARSPRPHGVP